MFKDLQKGYPISLLDKSGDKPSYKVGTVIGVSVPRFDNRNQNPPFTTDKVVDLTVEFEGKTSTYVVNENANMASTKDLTLACDSSLIANEVRAMLKQSQDVLASVDAHKVNIEVCEGILGELNPSFAESKEQNARIDRLEKTMADMSSYLSDIKKILTASSKPTKS